MHIRELAIRAMWSLPFVLGALHSEAGTIAPVDLFTVGDEAATFVEDTGLNWLDLTFTHGMSLSQVKADTTLGGLLDSAWRIAVLSEVDSLHTAYGFTPDAGCANGAQHCSPTGENAASAVNMVFDFVQVGAASMSGFFENPNLAAGMAGRSFVDHGNFGDPASSVDARTDFATLDTLTISTAGVFLVRDPNAIAPVPLPPSLFMFGLAIASLWPLRHLKVRTES